MKSSISISRKFLCNDPIPSPVTSARQSPLVLQEALETEPSLTPEIVPPPPPRPEPRSTSSPPIPNDDHHRDLDVETSRDQEDQLESRPDAPLSAAFLPRRSARVAHAPPPSTTRSASGSHAPPPRTVFRRRR
ncbi:hypothetical protein F2Q68_00017156 [Brassica cretica]|uniref:Uncharacterized protein n=1 Tax=Brassica cretica TaxID=69181 RepID=A0A8S9HG02_BRACR|nr:hypothetical protein F2Q68_00017156 [Brassica cretica]